METGTPRMIYQAATIGKIDELKVDCSDAALNSETAPARNEPAGRRCCNDLASLS